MEYTLKKRGGEGTVRHYLGQLAHGFEWKVIFSFFGTVIAYVEGFYSNLLWGFLGLFVLDLITGVMKSRYNNVPITSKRLRESVVKLGAYMVLLTALIITSKHEPSFGAIVTSCYYYFMFTELKSVMENAREMGVKIPDLLNSRVNSKLSENDDKKSEDKSDIKDKKQKEE